MNILTHILNANIDPKLATISIPLCIFQNSS